MRSTMLYVGRTTFLRPGVHTGTRARGVGEARRSDSRTLKSCAEASTDERVLLRNWRIKTNFNGSLLLSLPLRTEHAVARGPDGRTQRAAFVKEVKIGITISILCISINRLYITVRSFRSVLSIA